MRVLVGHTNLVGSVAWHPSGTRLASASWDHTVKIWNPEMAIGQATLEGHTRGVHSVTWHPDGNRLASASDDETIKIWDPETATVQVTLKGHTRGIQSVACGTPAGLAWHQPPLTARS